MGEVSDAIRKYAIKNAHDYGKAETGSVLGKVIPFAGGMPLHELKLEVERIVLEVNKLDRAELEEAYKPHSAEFERKAEETFRKTEKPRMVIEGAVEGKVVTRIPPGPSGYMHIGHVKQAFLSEEAARVYKGKFYRYFDDTNPEKCEQKYVDAMVKDHKWLGLKFNKTYYASDFVDEMYPNARKMIENGKAYVCMCSREVMKKRRFDGQECDHRKQPAKENLELFEGMLKGEFKEGQAVVRYKGEMSSPNTILRDPVLLRIVEAPHYRAGSKYRIWPVYDFNTPIVDSLQGVTDVIRSKEYELHDELSRQLLHALGMRTPRYHLEARLNIKGNITQKRDIKKLIDEKKIDGWDDPRLMTIMSLRRRGILPEAIRNFVMRLGMTKTDSSVPLDMLMAENKKVIDPIAKHLFFVADPVKLSVSGAVEMDAKLKLHPNNDFGFREYKTGDAFYISKEDADSLGAGEVIRLKDLMDVKILKKGKSIKAERCDGGAGGKIIQWVSKQNFKKCEVLVPGPIVDDEGNFNPDSLQAVAGFVESYIKNLQVREVVQFERYGYCVIDRKRPLQLIYISR